MSTLTRIDECRHGLDTRTCSLCRSAAGYVPGTDRQRNDCTVRTIVTLTGASYDEAVELLAAAGRRGGKGTSAATVHAVLAAAGWTVSETSLTIAQAVASGRTFHVAGRRPSGGHSWAIVNGAQVNGWSGGFRYRIWEVS